MDAAKLVDWLALASLRLSPRHLSEFKNLELSWTSLLTEEAETRAMLGKIGFNFERYQPTRKRLELGKKLLDWCVSEHWQPVTADSILYPELLGQIADPPPVLFCRGDLELLKTPQLAVVGSRNSSAYGENLAASLSSELSRRGLSITSGLALGIDRAAHLGALKVKGPTLAVMATGPDRIYPAKNHALSERIVGEGGLLITEKLPGTQPKPYLFPERNRLISGLSLGTLVVEANLKSGSLITGRMAVEQGREVMAVPGALTNPRARGCHRLIQQGAALVESANDIMQVLYPGLRQALDQSDSASELNEQVTPLSPILSALETGGLSLDQLNLKTGLGISELSFKIAELEMAGWVTKQGAKYTRLR